MTSHYHMSRGARRWCFTLNNYTPEEELTFRQLGQDIENSDWLEYLIYGREVGEQGTRHLQGYLMAKHPMRWSTINNKIFGERDQGRIHWETSRGTPQQAINYCKKDGDFQEFGAVGVKPKNQWDDIKEMIKSGRSLEEIRDKYPRTWAAYRTSIESWVNEGRQARLQHYNGDLQQKNTWIWGAPGVGKSKKAREEGTSFYNKAVNKWWDGYNGEEVVILEDVDPDRCKMLVHHLKIWLDRYIFTAEVKQSSTVLSPKSYRMIITSNYSPDECFNQTDLEAIRRRLHVVHMTSL